MRRVGASSLLGLTGLLLVDTWENKNKRRQDKTRVTLPPGPSTKNLATGIEENSLFSVEIDAISNKKDDI